ncbi:tRNA synthetase class II core domain-containing protein [Hirsutella rhossiliensis]|uniref:proline--tRNA ligase n=1 Tax=Hirsutella rhossiliensis TaxID=111463 RepID=A0A9P8MSS8_9HYPO|nr:tRNA synthetase class II core domain-containing protein [Hirsutella rhossiliensis]KAH0960625.1 tRNA synthetase class II core domain-containing protein [Hirsutella rhossiliensis]
MCHGRSSLKHQTRAFSRSSASLRPRSVLSGIWLPTGGLAATEVESGHGKLVRAGFVRQAQSGIFQMLPLGLRVQQKIEALLDRHMQSIGASRLALSAITSEELWRKSGRLEHVSPELFRLTDRRKVPLMLSPTHEEEITTLVAGTRLSNKDLPLRLYQTTRKYRDEMRPRHGLLRSREFVMKDLYTFDTSVEAAVDTYREVSGAYRAFFADLKLPMLVAEASSGNMGGDHSHEYHLTNPIGEDTVVTCSSCGYTASDQVAMSRPPSREQRRANEETASADFCVWRGITRDRKTLVNAWYPRHGDSSADADINIHAVEKAVPELDTSISDPLRFLSEARGTEADTPPATFGVVNVVDSRLAPAFARLQTQLPIIPAGLGDVSATDGDGCPRCEDGHLRIQRALELGHTFYLGTRYSEPLGLTINGPRGPMAVQMGCYGLGISRIFGAVAEHLADDKGLNWPRAIAPFEVAVIPSSDVTAEARDFYDMLAGQGSWGAGLDVVLDDRKASFGWKMKDADTIGFPVIVVLGRAWREKGVCEVQCRRLGVKEGVSAEEVGIRVMGLLSQL